MRMTRCGPSSAAGSAGLEPLPILHNRRKLAGPRCPCIGRERGGRGRRGGDGCQGRRDKGGGQAACRGAPPDRGDRRRARSRRLGQAVGRQRGAARAKRHEPARADHRRSGGGGVDAALADTRPAGASLRQGPHRARRRHADRSRAAVAADEHAEAAQASRQASGGAALAAVPVCGAGPAGPFARLSRRRDGTREGAGREPRLRPVPL